MKTHPSRWKIRHESSKKHCQVLDLPLGSSARPVKITTKLFNRFYREWGVREPLNNAGQFAECLRTLRTNRVELKGKPQVNDRMVDEAYVWLELYEIEVSKYAVEVKESSKSQLNLALGAAVSPSVPDDRYDKVLIAVFGGLAASAGPLADPELLASRAKTITEAYFKLEKEEK